VANVGLALPCADNVTSPSVGSRQTSARAEQKPAASETVDPDTGEITAA